MVHVNKVEVFHGIVETSVDAMFGKKGVHATFVVTGAMLTVSNVREIVLDSRVICAISAVISVIESVSIATRISRDTAKLDYVEDAAKRIKERTARFCVN